MITSLMNWQIPLLIFPPLIGIAIFGYLLWSDRRHDRKVRSGNQPNK